MGSNEAAKINVLPGMSIENIKRNSPKGYGLAVNLFDWNKNGILEKEELNELNKYNVSLGKRNEELEVLTLNSKDTNNPKTISTVFSEKDIFSLEKNLRILPNLVYMHDNFSVDTDNFQRLEYTFKNQSLQIRGAQNEAKIVANESVRELDISDSNVETIVAQGADVDLTNVKNGDKETNLIMGNIHEQNLKVYGDTKLKFGK